MFKRLISRKSDRRKLLSDGTKVSVNYCVCVNNEDLRYFDDYKSALDFIENYRETNQLFNLAVFRLDTFSLISNHLNF